MLCKKVHKIGDCITKLRKGKGWTQIELAKKLDVSDKAVSKWESNKGEPSIEFLPKLAELFGVTIDYLMTGKETEIKIVTMNKIELCAKNDDVQMFAELLKNDSLKSKDENGHSFGYYLRKYKSKRIIERLFEVVNYKQLLGDDYDDYKWFDIDIFDLILVSNSTFLLDRFQNLNNGNGIYGCGFYSDKCIEKVVISNDIDKEFFEQYFSATYDNVLYPHNPWLEIISNGFKFALQYNLKDKVEYLLNLIVEINQEAISVKESESKNISSSKKIILISGTLNNYFSYNQDIYIGAIRVAPKELQLLLDMGFVDLAQKLNEFNKNIFPNDIISDEQIEVAKIKLIGGDKEKIAILSVTQNNILILDKLLATNDYKFIEKTLFNYPIHYYEYLTNLLNDKDYKTLYRFGIDNNMVDLYNAVLKEKSKIAEVIEKYCCGQAKLPKNLIAIQTANYHWINKVKHSSYINTYEPHNLSELMSDLQNTRQEIMQTINFEMNKQLTSGKLTNEFFIKELKKGNYEQVIIKLCVKIEAILKYDYRYSGTFEEMLNQFCSSNTCDVEMSRLLNKLRIVRNGVVHADSSDASMTRDELERLINYILKMEK